MNFTDIFFVLYFIDIFIANNSFIFYCHDINISCISNDASLPCYSAVPQWDKFRVSLCSSRLNFPIQRITKIRSKRFSPTVVLCVCFTGVIRSHSLPFIQFGVIGHFHDDDIWLPILEFISFLPSYWNLSIPLRFKPQ